MSPPPARVVPTVQVRGRPPVRKPVADLRVDWTACDSRGLCAELLPELIGRDDWGYPVLHTTGVPSHLEEYARRAVSDCPTLALRLLPPREPPPPPR